MCIKSENIDHMFIVDEHTHIHLFILSESQTYGFLYGCYIVISIELRRDGPFYLFDWHIHIMRTTKTERVIWFFSNKKKQIYITHIHITKPAVCWSISCSCVYDVYERNQAIDSICVYLYVYIMLLLTVGYT